MFTGIVQRLGRVESFERDGELARLRLDIGPLAEGAEPGASIAINGVCLTVTSIAPPLASFDVAAESLRLTNLSELAVGDRVNAERSFRIGDEVGGHVLSGHVLGMATIVERRQDGDQAFVEFELPPDALGFVFHKGYVGLDGASLTVAFMDRARGRCGVNLIPETLERTRFGWLEPGARVNVEVDAQTQAIVETVRGMLTDQAFVRAILDGVADSRPGT